MKKLSFIIILTLANYYLSAQMQINNKILERFLNDTAFSKFIIPGFDKDCDTLYIVDTTELFSGSSLKIGFAKPIIITHYFSKTPPFRKWYCHNLVLTIKHTSKKNYEIEYFHEPSNSVGFVRYRLVRGYLKKIKCRYGQY